MSILTLLKRSDIVESMYEIFVKNIFLRIWSVNFGRNEKALIWLSSVQRINWYLISSSNRYLQPIGEPVLF